MHGDAIQGDLCQVNYHLFKQSMTIVNIKTEYDDYDDNEEDLVQIQNLIALVLSKHHLDVSFLNYCFPSHRGESKGVH